MKTNSNVGTEFFIGLIVGFILMMVVVVAEYFVTHPQDLLEVVMAVGVLLSFWFLGHVIVYWDEQR